jgi:cell wall-associated NlpC family hydrolase
MTSFAVVPRSVRRPVAVLAVLSAGLAAPCSAQRLVSAQRPSALAALKPVDLPLPKLAEAPKPFAAWSESVHALHDSIVVSIVRTQIGTRYVHGGTTPQGGFDCSGLVRYVMAALQVHLPRTAAEQARVGMAVARDTTQLRPGDLLTFGKGRSDVSHIGIYVGNGRYVHASSVAGRVIESALSRPASPLIRKWHGSRRVVAATDSVVKGDG